MVEAYDKWRRWADEKVIRIITQLAVYDGDKEKKVDVDDGLEYQNKDEKVIRMIRYLAVYDVEDMSDDEINYDGKSFF